MTSLCPGMQMGIQVIFIFVVQHCCTGAKLNGAVVRQGGKVSRRWQRLAQKLCPFAFAWSESIPEESLSQDPCCSLGNVCWLGSSSHHFLVALAELASPSVLPHQAGHSEENALPPFHLFRHFGFREVVVTAFLWHVRKLEEEAQLRPVSSASQFEQPWPSLVSAVWKLHCMTQKSAVIYTSTVAFLAITFHCSFSLNL